MSRARMERRAQTKYRKRLTRSVYRAFDVPRRFRIAERDLIGWQHYFMGLDAETVAKGVARIRSQPRNKHLL